MLDTIECPVCLELIKCDNNGDSIIFECCTNRVHIDCLKAWSTCDQNTNKRACIICQTETNFLYDFYRSLNSHSSIASSSASSYSSTSASSSTSTSASPTSSSTTLDTIINISSTRPLDPTRHYDGRVIIITPYLLYSQSVITIICFFGLICLFTLYFILS